MERQNTTSCSIKYQALYAILFVVICSCSSRDSRTVRFEDCVKVDDTTNIYVYKYVGFLHEEYESYFAMGRSFCDVYNDKKRTIAQADGFAQIDTVINGKIRIASASKVMFYQESDARRFETTDFRPMDEPKNRLGVLGLVYRASKCR
jgi:hypothetical protein